MDEITNTVMAFTEWLHGKRDFVLVVQGEGNENLCVVDGNIDKMINTIANGMLQHEDLHRLIFKSATAVVNYKMNKMAEEGIDLEQFNRDIEDMGLGDDV